MSGVRIGGPVSAESVRRRGLRRPPPRDASCAASAPRTRSPTRSARCASCPPRSTSSASPSPSRSPSRRSWSRACSACDRARKLRGDTTRGRHAVRGIAMPVLHDALDRSLQLAAAMDSRGYGRSRRRCPPRVRRITAALLLGGLLGLCLGHVRAARHVDAAAARRARCSSLGLALCGARARARRPARAPHAATGPTRGRSRSGRTAIAGVGRGGRDHRRGRARTRRRSNPSRVPARVADAAACPPRSASCCALLPAVAHARRRRSRPRRPARPRVARRPRRATGGSARRDPLRARHDHLPRRRRADAARRRPRRSPRASCASSSARPAPGKSTLLGAINGLVPHFTGGELRGRVTVDGRDTRTHPPRELADVVGVVGQDPLAGLRHRHASRRSSPTGWSSSRSRRDVMRKRVEETLDLLGLADLRDRALHAALRRAAAARRDRRGAHRAPEGARARRADLRARPDRRRGGARRDHAARARPRRHRGDGRAPARTGRAVRRPRRARARRRHASSTASPPSCSRARPSRRRSSSSAGSPAGSRCRCRCATPAARAAPLRRRARRRHCRRPRCRSRRRSPTVALRGRGVVVRYGAVVAVRDVDLDLRGRRDRRAHGPQRRGQVVAAVGAAGLGRPRTAAASTSAAAIPPTSTPARARTLVGLVPQTPADLLYLDTVGEELAQADAESARRAGPRPRAARPPRARHRRRRSTRATCPRASGSRSCSRSSSRPRRAVVLLDEPTRGLDYRAKHDARRASCASSRPTVTPIVVSTHDVEFVADGRAPRRRDGRGRDRRRRPDRRRDRRVARVRAAGREDPRAAAVAHRRPGRSAPACSTPRRVVSAVTERPCASGRARSSRSIVASVFGVIAFALAVLRRARTRRSARAASRRSIFGALLLLVLGVVLARAVGRRPRRQGARDARRAVRARRRAAPARRGHRRRRDDLLPARPRRAARSGPASASASAARRCSRRRSSPAASGRGCRTRCSRARGSASAPGCCRARRGRARDRDARRVRRGRRRSSYGLLLNLSFWPFTLGGDTQLSFVPGAPVVENLHRYLVFDVTTSLGWDTGRAITNAVLIRARRRRRPRRPPPRRQTRQLRRPRRLHPVEPERTLEPA